MGYSTNGNSSDSGKANRLIAKNPEPAPDTENIAATAIIDPYKYDMTSSYGYGGTPMMLADGDKERRIGWGAYDGGGFLFQFSNEKLISHAVVYGSADDKKLMGVRVTDQNGEVLAEVLSSKGAGIVVGKTIYYSINLPLKPIKNLIVQTAGQTYPGVFTEIEIYAKPEAKPIIPVSVYIENADGSIGINKTAPTSNEVHNGGEIVVLDKTGKINTSLLPVEIIDKTITVATPIDLLKASVLLLVKLSTDTGKTYRLGAAGTDYDLSYDGTKETLTLKTVGIYKVYRVAM